METLLTISQAAKAIGVTKQTINGWERAGLIRFTRIGGRPVFNSAMIAAMRKLVRPVGRPKKIKKASEDRR